MSENNHCTSSGDSEKPHSLTSRFILYQNIISWVVHHFINHPHEFLHALGDLDQSRKKLTMLFLVQSICMMLHYTASWLLWRGWPTSWFVLAEDANLFFFKDKDFSILESEINNEPGKVHLWLSANKLSVNIEKSHFVLFHPVQKQIPKKVMLLINNQSSTGDILEFI